MSPPRARVVAMEAPAPPSELVSEEGRNRKAVLCRRCGSRVLQPGTALFSRRQVRARGGGGRGRWRASTPSRPPGTPHTVGPPPRAAQTELRGAWAVVPQAQMSMSVVLSRPPASFPARRHAPRGPGGGNARTRESGRRDPGSGRGDLGGGDVDAGTGRSGRGDPGEWARGPGGGDVDAGTGRSGRKDRGSGRGDWAKWTQGPGEWTRGLGEVDAGTPGSGRGRKGRQAGDVLRARPEPAERWLRVGEPLPRRESPGVWVFRCSDPVPCARCPESGGGWTQTLGFK